MKARKQDLDLSWEDVLHRGLRRGGAGDRSETERGPRTSRRQQYADLPPRDPISDPAGFADDLKRQIQGLVRDSLRSSFDPDFDGPSGGDPLESEVTSLESAEDATLVFDFLGDRAGSPANQVPLRVTLEASADGLQVDVVAVRQGKTATEMNAFDPAVRKRIVEGLAAGEATTLRLATDDEGYRVSPTLSWSRADGTPTVADVAIDEVRFDVK